LKEIDKIKLPIAREMEEFEIRFREDMKSDVPLLDKITHYILKRKGKQLRPMFVFLSAASCHQITESTFRAASLIELLHTATLVHDDVVDDSYERRGFLSLNALWKNKIAVLVGDYLLSRGLLLAVNKDESELLKIVSTAVREMSEGELLQIEKARRLDITEEIYFNIIRQKTASLIAACCASGAASAGGDKNTIEFFRTFGEKTGIAFQLKDDLLDYSSGDIGKPTGIDLKEKKMTLPVIHALQKASKTDKRKAIDIIKNHSDQSEKTAWVVDMVISSGGLDYASRKMTEIRDHCLTMIGELKNSQATNSLRELVLYTTERNK
jgi:octaprenyl-diphosphate synthase